MSERFRRQQQGLSELPSQTEELLAHQTKTRALPSHARQNKQPQRLSVKTQKKKVSGVFKVAPPRLPRPHQAEQWALCGGGGKGG